MKKNILKYSILLVLLVVILIVYLSLVGIETERFNNQIKNRISEINKNIDIDIKKIKFTLDPLNLKIFAKTVGSTVYISKKPLELESIKTQVSLGSLIKNKITSSNIEVTTRSIMLNDLIKFIRVTNNRSELFILEKTIKKGHITLDLSLNFDDDGKIKNDYEIIGSIKDANINFLNKAKFNNLNFNFNIKKNNYLLNEIKFKVEKVNFISKKINIIKKKNNFLINGIVKNDSSNVNSNILQLLNLNFKNIIIDDVKFKTDNKFSFEINKKFKVKNIILNSDINISNLKYKRLDIIQNYFQDIDKLILLNNHKLNINYKDNNLSVKGEGEIQLNNNEVDQIKYLINKKDKDFNIDTELLIKNINLKTQDYLKNFFPQINKNINFNNQKLKIKYNNNILSLFGSGKFKINKDYEEIHYFFEKKENQITFNTDLNIKNTKFKIDNINYKKRDDTKMRLQIQGDQSDNKNLNIKSFIIKEKNNNIKITNLSLNDSNQIIKIDQANFNYFDTENKKNNYNLKK